ncbi:unnamed protein product [Trichogramma brassicae]|uniref:Uncharacterized protein n=1 Tax=Trichogramma brassicae TaxID=86971 RepID=A0A6H5IT55_9HYME|nr:unnamed protein product [Trichogramma brassicae]
MDYIIDLQGYVCPDGKFLPKEIAVVSLLLHSSSNWIISPPDDYLNYSTEVRKCIELYSQKVHGIQWPEGSVCADKLYAHLKNILLSANNIYIFVDSSSKKTFLEILLGRKVVNLCKFLCPAASILCREFDFKTTCLEHMLKSEIRLSREFQCALNNCRLYKRWVLQVTRNHIRPRNEIDSNTVYAALRDHLRRNNPDGELELSSEDEGEPEELFGINAEDLNPPERARFYNDRPAAA